MKEANPGSFSVTQGLQKEANILLQEDTDGHQKSVSSQQNRLPKKAQGNMQAAKQERV